MGVIMKQDLRVQISCPPSLQCRQRMLIADSALLKSCKRPELLET